MNAITYNQNNLSDGNFNFWVELEPISKSQQAEDGQWRIKGRASTSDLDLQGERVVQSGLDLSYIKAGQAVLNSDHRNGPEFTIGEITDARLEKDGLHIEGILWKGHPEAERWWKLLNAIDSSGGKKKIGFSIEGKVLKRQGNSILRAWVKAIALTLHPVNTSTFCDVVKALSAEKWCKHPNKSDKIACVGCPGKVHCKTQEKSLTTSTSSMLIPESLDKKPTLNKNISKVQFKLELMKKGYTPTAAKIVADSIFLK